MLRIYLMRQWSGLSDPLLEDSLCEVASMGHFAGLALNADRIPDESAILQCRHMLARHRLRQGWFKAVDGRLREPGYHLSRGTMVDATLQKASGSTKHKPASVTRRRARRAKGAGISLT